MTVHLIDRKGFEKFMDITPMTPSSPYFMAEMANVPPIKEFSIHEPVSYKKLAFYPTGMKDQSGNFIYQEHMA